jgi:hypothetical protein
MACFFSLFSFSLTRATTTATFHLIGQDPKTNWLLDCELTMRAEHQTDAGQ